MVLVFLHYDYGDNHELNESLHDDLQEQYFDPHDAAFQFISTNSGGVEYQGYTFHKSGVEKYGLYYYRCGNKRKTKCKVTLTVDKVTGVMRSNNANQHNHPPKTKNTSSMAVIEIVEQEDKKASPVEKPKRKMRGSTFADYSQTKYNVKGSSESIKSFELPMSDFDELLELEKNVVDNEDTEKDLFIFLRTIKDRTDTRLAKYIRKIITDDILEDCNWGGLKGKKSLCSLKIFNQLVYSVWCQDNDEKDFAYFDAEMRTAVRFAKNRINQRSHRLRMSKGVKK